MFHVYVNPIFGDDYMATLKNPGNPASGDPWLTAASVGTGATRMLPLDAHRDTTAPKPITGYLQHAPYEFKTINGSATGLGHGALQYVRKLFPASSATSPGIPWTHPGNSKTVTHVVIHCLPGLYGHAQFPGERDPVSNLPWNGETFPIVLGGVDSVTGFPYSDRISLQGTSTRDTVLDARRIGPENQAQNPPILLVIDIGVTSNGFCHEEAFVDGFLFAGARLRPTPQGIPPRMPYGAAVLVQGHASTIRISISNCVFTDNDIGLALDSNYQPPPFQASRFHEPRVISNSFVWNRVGIWCGDLNPPGNYLEAHTPVVIDNLLDCGPPPEISGAGGVPGGIACFMGITTDDLEVVSRAGLPIGQAPGGFGLDFNAWDPTKVNSPVQLSYDWPAISQQAIQIPPRVPLTSYVDNRLGGTGAVLYIADALRRGGQGMRSQHDFRLVPHASDNATAPGLRNPLVLNPLVDRGIDGVGFSPTARIQVRHGGFVECRGPGLPAGVEEVPLTGWICDGEGLGNPRIVTRTGWAPPPDDYGAIDLGADECDELIMAGEVLKTRMFGSRMAPGIGSHARVYFFNLTNAQPVNCTRPQANTRIGKQFPWYAHVGAPPGYEQWTEPPTPVYGAAWPTNYTTGFLGSIRYTITNWGAGPRPAFMRSLECDFSGSLALDVHSLWGLLLDTLEPTKGAPGWDPYAANPWFSSTAVQGLQQADNPSLYWNPGAASGHGSNLLLYRPADPFNRTFVADGRVHPGGAWVAGPPWVVPGTVQFGPFGSCTGAAYQPGIWGFNDAPTGCPDVLPIVSGYDGHGVRYNCELHPTRPSNLQTFLSVVSAGDEVPPAEAGAMSSIRSWLQGSGDRIQSRRMRK